MREAAIEKAEKKLDQMVSRLITGVMIGIAIFAAFLLWGDVQGVVGIISTIPVLLFLLTVASTLASYFIRFIKWHYMLKRLDIDVPLKESLHIFLIGLSMSITPGKMGELLKSFLIKKVSNVHVSRSASAVFVDRLTDLFAMLLLISLGISLFSVGYVPFLCFVVILIGMTLILRSKSLSIKCIHLCTHNRFLNKYRETLLTLYDSIYTLMNWRTFLLIILISTVAWFMECVSLYILIDSLKIDLSFIHNIFIFSFGTLAGALSMLPGGLGIAEGSITGMFIYFGLDKSTAVTVTLLIRVVTLWLGVVIGLLLFMLKRKHYQL
jgi:uncharacterized protein (TIRG00374 family)